MNAPDKMQQEFYDHLMSIADWWLAHGQDKEYGGFHGQVDNDNTPCAGADKGAVLGARILWFFSELAGQIDRLEYRQAAARAYEALSEHFFDSEHGGVVWSVDVRGRIKDGKKQLYAQAFAIYALTAYYRLTGEERALTQAKHCFDLLESRGVDRERGGYLEAFARDWTPLRDVRLSDKDLNYPKTMNTHLHVLEAYTALYQVDPRPEVRLALLQAVAWLDEHFVNRDGWHLRMFLDMEWSDCSTELSYGHDIEASWLLIKAVNALDDDALRAKVVPTALHMAEVCLVEALGEHGEMYDGRDLASGKRHEERIWWVQAEALVGFINAYALTGDARYWQAADGVWRFVRRYQLHETGEWRWLSRLDPGHDDHYKAGFWKCPYHNGRAMLELWRHLAKLVP